MKEVMVETGLRNEAHLTKGDRHGEWPTVLGIYKLRILKSNVRRSFITDRTRLKTLNIVVESNKGTKFAFPQNALDNEALQ